MGEQQISLARMGYKGPRVSQWSRAVDEYVYTAMKEGILSAAMVAQCIEGLVDSVVVFAVKGIVMESTDCFCAGQLTTNKGSVIILVPWLRQYEAGAVACLYIKGAMRDEEVDFILARLVEKIGFVFIPNTQKYLM